MSSRRVLPSSSRPRHTLFLSAADIVWRFFSYNRRILFYKLINRAAADDGPMLYVDAVSKLKHGLSEALVEFFPWTGRLIEQEDGRLVLDCNELAGVEFTEAMVEEGTVTFSALEEDAFQYRNFFKDLAPNVGDDVANADCHPRPLLSVQVTRFPQDEGLVLGIAHSHVLADGYSLWHFLKSWGECARGLPISMAPVHARELLGPDNLPLPSPPTDPSARSLTRGGTFVAGRKGAAPSQLAQWNFHFTAETIQALKQRAAAVQGSTDAPFSSYQVLCAHLWKHLTAARGVSAQTGSGLFVVADFRNRLSPPLPRGFFGSAVDRKLAKVSAGELQEESIGATAKRVQELIQSLDGEFFKGKLGMVEFMEPAQLVSRFAADMEPGMVSFSVASSPKFPVHDVEFGFDKPLSVQAPHIRGDGEIVLFAGKDGKGSVDVSVALPSPAILRLKEAQGFLGV